MMPEHAKLFESPVQRLRAGANVQLVGSGGVFTFAARPVQEVQEVVEEDNVTRQGLEVYKDRGAWKVYPATVLGEMPTIGGTPLDDGTAPTLTVASSGTRYVVLNISGTPATTTLSGRVFFHPAMSSITVTVTVETSAPTNADLIDSGGSFKVLLATFEDGILTSQNGYGPITGYVQDQLDGSGDGYLLLTYA